jgi:hypothetical protein
MGMRAGEVRIGDWIATWMMRETGPDDRDRWRPVILGYEDRPQSGQTYYPEDPILGDGGNHGGDPEIVTARGLDENGFPDTLEAEWHTRGGRLRQTYRPTGPSSSG